MFDYVDGAAEDERTLGRNSGDFGAITFKPRVLRDVSAIDPCTTLLGRPLPLPLVLPPPASRGSAIPEGELAVARAAARAGLPYTLSTLGTRSIEEVAAVSAGTKWFQIYVWRDRGLVKEMIDRADAAGYEALDAHRRQRGPRQARARRPARLHAAAADRAAARSSTAPCTRDGPGRSCAASRSGSPTSSAGRVGDGAEAVKLHDYINTSVRPERLVARPRLAARPCGPDRSS